MRVFRNIDEVVYDRNTAVTIGTFDGVHIGHREILSRLKAVSSEKNLRALVVTFEPHPQIVLRSKSPDIKVLTELDEKLRILSSLEIENVLVMNFTKEFSRTGAEEFYSDYLVGRTGMSELILGYDHMFGKDREGNLELLRTISGKYGFNVERVDEFKLNGQHVSSTVIRKLLESGEARLAAEFLGMPYTLSGIVAEGRKLGRELDMPTANIVVDSPYKLIPASGIYSVLVETDGDTFGGVMNIGTNPTVTDDNKLKLEVHLIDFDGELYGKKISVSFLEYIRSEKKFDSLEELKIQMQNDKESSREILQNFQNQITIKANN